METKHISVLLNEAIDALNLKKDGLYVDCTLGGGGHSSLILSRISNGHLFGFDQDAYAIKIAKEKLSLIGDNFTIINRNFSDMKDALNQRGISKVDGILYDLGVSSFQIDLPERGFSYRLDGPLDMRMNQNQVLDAYIVVNTYSETQLKKILYEYGEERFSRIIAKNICEQRKNKEIETTEELVNIIVKSIPLSKQKEGHPAKRTFQAIRIEVNNEIKPLYNCIGNCIDVLKNNGRLAVITFHSLEDRAVKNAFIEAEGVCKCPKDLPYCVCGAESKGKIITKKPILPTENEQNENSRAKSAKLRVFEKKI